MGKYRSGAFTILIVGLTIGRDLSLRASGPTACFKALTDRNLIDTGGDSETSLLSKVLKPVSALDFHPRTFELLGRIPFLVNHPLGLSSGSNLAFVVEDVPQIVGKTNQTLLAQAVLQYYLPHAAFWFNRPSFPTNRRLIPLNVDDPGIFDEPMANMLLAKPIFSRGVDIPYAETRELFGIAKGAKVLSVYLESRYQLDELERPEFGSQFPIVLLSINSNFDPASTLNEKLKAKYFVIRLSDLHLHQVRGIQTSKPILIYNDLKGYVPYLHAIADVAAVFGRVNFYEALNVGTPTVVIDPFRGEPEGPANSRFFNESIQSALSTGAFTIVSHQAPYDSTLNEFAALHRISLEQRPFYSEAAARAFVQNIENYLRQQLSGHAPD